MKGKIQKQWQVKDKELTNLVFVQDAPIPEPQGYDMLIRIFTAGVNAVDWKRCTHLYFGPGLVGLDAVGIVEAVGPNVSPAYVPGKTLVASFGSLLRQNDQGAFAEYTLTDSRYAAVIPESLLNQNSSTLYSDLAASLCPGYTAYQIVYTKLKLLQIIQLQYLKPKQIYFPLKKNFVITCAAGGVGIFCLQLLNHYKNSIPQEYATQIKLIATCSGKNFDYVKSMGATHCIDYNHQDIEAEVKAITNGVGADVWVDLIDSKSAQAGLRSLAFNGEMVVVVEEANYKDQLFMKAITVHHICLGMIHASNDPEQIVELKRFGEDFWRLMGEGITKPTRYKEIGIEDIKQSLEDLQNQKVGIKLVMVNK